MADLLDRLKILGDRANKLKDQLQTEEATKHSLILPFIIELGYDVYNPNDVIPEYTADFGTKKGEKIDYAILKDNEPVIIIECKHCKEDLSKHGSQLFRYFSTLPAKFAILTNGIRYMFFTDIEEQNKLDEKAFFEFDITQISDYQIEQLKQFHKSALDIEKAADAASELKYMKEMTSFFKSELINPTEILVEFIVRNISTAKLTQKRLSLMSPLAKKAVKQVTDSMFMDKITKTLEDKKDEEEAVKEAKEHEETPIQENEHLKVFTTQEELDGYNIIKSLLRKDIDHRRITYKDYQGFFAVRLDDMMTKTFCKLYFNNPSKLSISVISKDKKEEFHDLKEIDDIYDYADSIVNNAKMFL